MVVGVAVFVGSGKQGGSAVRCGVLGKPRRALYRRGKAVQGEENILPVTGGGGAAARSIREESRRGRRGSVRDSRCGAVGYDPSCR
jgi:hypothetical protein